MLKSGDLAPDFTLQDQSGESVTLSSFRGRKSVILVFYPGDSTPLCTAQLCEFRDAYEDLAACGAAVFGVNPRSAESHRRFMRRNEFPFPLLVDEGARVSRLFGTAWGFGPIQVTLRGVVAIDQDGRIVYAQPGKPPVAEIHDVLMRTP